MSKCFRVELDLTEEQFKALRQTIAYNAGHTVLGMSRDRAREELRSVWNLLHEPGAVIQFDPEDGIELSAD